MSATSDSNAAGIRTELRCVNIGSYGLAIVSHIFPISGA